MFFGSKAKLAFEKSNLYACQITINEFAFFLKLIFDVSLGGQKTELLHCPLLAL